MPPLRSSVLLHGFAGSAASWGGRLEERLGAAGHAPVPLDLPGHGAGARGGDPETVRLDATLRAVAHAVEAPFDLIGYSMGGRVALHVAAAFPERVSRLVLESASPGLETEAERDARRRSDEVLARRLEREGMEAFVHGWEALPLLETQRRLDEAVLARQRAERLANDARALAAALRGLGTGSLPSLWDRLADVTVPALLVAGALDGKFVAIAERMASRMPNARLEVVPGAGHNVHLEEPDAWLDAVVGFLDEGGASARR